MPNVNDLIPELGQVVVDLLADHGKWDRAVAQAIRESKTMSNFEVWSEGGSDQWSSLDDDDLVDELTDLFDEMWKRFDKAGTPWKRATFSLTSDGEAKVDFEYDD